MLLYAETHCCKSSYAPSEHTFPCFFVTSVVRKNGTRCRWRLYSGPRRPPRNKHGTWAGRRVCSVNKRGFAAVPSHTSAHGTEATGEQRAGGRRGGVPKTRRTSAAMRAFAPLYPTPLLFPGPRSVCPILSRVRPLTGPSISHLASGPLEPQCSEAFGRCLGRWKSRPLFDDFRLVPLWWFFPQLSFFGNQ